MPRGAGTVPMGDPKYWTLKFLAFDELSTFYTTSIFGDINRASLYMPK
jgi:hypothetical protein